MRTLIQLLPIFCFAGVLLAADVATAPPVAKQIPKKTTIHGRTITDNYFWLREKTNPEVISYLEAENRYTEQMMKGTDSLQSKLYTEILGRIQETDLSVPTKDGEYFYYTRTEKGKQYPIYCRKKGSLNAAEEIMIDGNVLAEGHKYFRVGPYDVSPDHKLLAYGTDTAGDEVYTVVFKDLATGKLHEDKVSNAYYSTEWAEDNRTLFYTVLNAAKRPYQIWRHTLGTTKDELVYEEKDERFTVSLGKTSSRAFIIAELDSSLTSEIRYIPASEPRAPWKVLLPRQHDVLYDITHHGDFFYIRTNDGARNFRLVKAPVKDPSRKNWKDALPARPGVTLESARAFKNHLITIERDRGLRKIRVETLSGGKAHYIDFPDPVYTAGMGANAEFDTRLLRFNYTSLVTPSSVYDYNMETRERELKKQQPVLGGYDPTQYATERIFAKAPDGVEVPISLVYKKGLKKDGSARMLLYGYGSYGSPSDPTFASSRLSLLDRGMVFAIAHIRGGGDLGKPWHEDGRLLKKKNTFIDFIACAEKLIADKYTSKDRLAIMGGSAGGLLMGAVTNMRPDLFAVVIAKVAFVDVMNTMLDASLPLTVGEYEEWGNPNDKKYFDYILTYSPYDNVKAAKYPKMLFTGGLNDPRVSYWEPTKWVAKQRATNKDVNIILKTNMGAGHFGASGRYDALKETAFDWAFLLTALGVE